jgi:glycosyltransferase involved in cell wall biosynthesis
MIKEAVESVWASQRAPEEVLLIDDGSQGEDTLVRIKELETSAFERGLTLRVIQQRNGGLAKARNTGLEAANGEFISFLDGDDLIEPEFYRIALQTLEKYPRLGGVAAWASIFGKDVADGFWNAPQTELPFIFIQNSVIVPCLARKELLRELGGYDTRQRYNYEDWELSIRMLTKGWPIVTVPMHLTKYRVRPDSLYRSMTYVQNQVMRELLLTTHRETLSRFAVEVAMQIENQWMKYVYPDNRSAMNGESRNSSAQSNVGTPFTDEVVKKYRSRLFQAMRKLWWAAHHIVVRQ